MDYVKSHTEPKRASTGDQNLLRNKLCTFLLAHITHAEDNARFSRQEPSTIKPTTFQTPRSISASGSTPASQTIHPGPDLSLSSAPLLALLEATTSPTYPRDTSARTCAGISPSCAAYRTTMTSSKGTDSNAISIATTSRISTTGTALMPKNTLIVHQALLR